MDEADEGADQAHRRREFGGFAQDVGALGVALNLLSYPQLDAFVERARSLTLEGGV